MSTVRIAIKKINSLFNEKWFYPGGKNAKKGASWSFIQIVRTGTMPLNCGIYDYYGNGNQTVCIIEMQAAILKKFQFLLPSRKSER